MLSAKLERMSAVSLLSHLASSAGLLRSADGAFAQVPVGDRLEIYKLKSAAFRHWLIDGYMRYRSEPPSGWAISRVVGMREARARFQGGIPDVFIRVGKTGGELGYYLRAQEGRTVGHPRLGTCVGWPAGMPTSRSAQDLKSHPLFRLRRLVSLHP